MEETRKRQRRVERHARRLAQESLAAAGSRTNVGKALGRSRSTISHEVTTRGHPVLEEAFGVLLNLLAHPGVCGRAFVDRAAEALELNDILDADTETLVARGLWLVEHENHFDALEDLASIKTAAEHMEACARHGAALLELRAIEAELLTPERGRLDLLALYRQRAVQA